MLAYEFLPAEARAAFMSEYGRVDEDVLTRARLRAAFHAISLTWCAHETADADLIVEGMQALQFVLDS